MNAVTPPPSELSVEEFKGKIERAVDIDASAEVVFESALEEMCAIPDGEGKPMNFKLERWPGGRWYRDLGNNAGHFWGHVQVIKPPTLIEITGPMMLSMAVINHVTYRITRQSENKSNLKITHRVFGEFDPEFLKGIHGGWSKVLEAIKTRVATKSRSKFL